MELAWDIYYAGLNDGSWIVDLYGTIPWNGDEKD